MSKLIQYRFRIIALVIFMLILATASYGFAASNTVADAGKAGEGSATVSGYIVTNVQYTLNSTDPRTVDSVYFELDSAATSVYAGLDDGSLTWNPCLVSGSGYTCDFTLDLISTFDLTTLHVAAGQ